MVQEDVSHMKENGHFLTLLQEQPLIKSVIEHLDFSKVDFSDIVFNQEDENTYNFKDINVGKHQFKNVKVSIRPELSSIKMLTDETIFFDEPILYFNQEGFAHETEPLLINCLEVANVRRKLRSFSMLGRTVNLSIYKSSAYGCIIKLVFPDKERIDNLYNGLEI